MDEGEFWRLIDRSREMAEGDPVRQEDALRTLLVGCSREDLEVFARSYASLRWQAFDWNAWGAGYLLAGGMNGGGFADFREWLISRGRRIYRLALDDPDALADEIPQDAPTFSAEGLWGAAHDVYEQRFGEEMPAFDDLPMREKRPGRLGGRMETRLRNASRSSGSG